MNSAQFLRNFSSRFFHFKIITSSVAMLDDPVCRTVPCPEKRPKCVL